MPLQRLYRKISVFSLASLMVGTTLGPASAQNPTPGSKPKATTQKKSDQSKQSESRPQSDLERLQMELFKNSQLNKAGSKAGSGTVGTAKNTGGAAATGTETDEELDSFGNESIKIDTDLIQLDVTVIDQLNNPIFGLNKDDFTIYENKVKQVVESVSREEIPISFGIVVDTSGSMRSRIQTISDAALGLIKQKRQDDEGFIAQFKTDYETIQDFSTDESDLEWGVGQFFTSGGTALLDAIINSSKYAQQKGKRRRKAIIVISDGLEANSNVKEQEVVDAIKENEVQLYMIGFMKDEDLSSTIGKTPAMKAKELLMRLAEDSGGRSFFPRNLTEIPAIAAQIGKDLRTQYIVSYYPTNEKKDGSYRAIRVDIAPKNGTKMVARARQGYFAGADKDGEAKQSEVIK